MTPHPRTCLRPGCERSTAWPTDPKLVAAFCLRHTEELLVPEPDTRPEWVRRLKAKDFTNAGAVL